jgi:hypothetical protein
MERTGGCCIWLRNAGGTRDGLLQATTGTLPKARAAHSATLVDGRRMLVFGGESQDGRLKDVWALDTKVSQSDCGGFSAQPRGRKQWSGPTIRSECE